MRAAAERTEALRRQRLAHDAEMRKAGRDVLRLEREVRRQQVLCCAVLCYILCCAIYLTFSVPQALTVMCLV